MKTARFFPGSACVLALALIVLLSSCRLAMVSSTPEYPYASCLRVTDAQGQGATLCLDYGNMVCDSVTPDPPGDPAQAFSLAGGDCRLLTRATIIDVEPGLAYGVTLWSDVPLEVEVRASYPAPAHGAAASGHSSAGVHFDIVSLDQKTSLARIFTPGDRPGKSVFEIYVSGKLASAITFLLTKD